MIKLLSLASLALFVLTLPTHHPDQASLGGRITDQELAPIAAATVSARNVFSGETEYVKSDSEGLYEFKAMKQGRYSVLAEAEGYGSTLVPAVILFRGQHTHLDLTLTVPRPPRLSNFFIARLNAASSHEVSSTL